MTELEAQLKELEPLKTAFDKQLADAARSADADRIFAQDQIAAYVRRSSVAEAKVATVTAQLAVAEETVQEQSDEIATLKAELLVLQEEELARRKREVAEARTREKEARYEAELKSALDKKEMQERNRLQAERNRMEAQEAEAQQRAEEARREAAAARETAMDEADAARRARDAQTEAEKELILAERKVARAKTTAEKLAARVNEIGPRPKSYSCEEWATVKADARRKARSRDCAYLRGLLDSHAFRPADIATVLNEKGLLHSIIFQCQEGFHLYFTAVSELMKKVETEEFGENLALFMVYELRMPLPLIHRLVQAACKTFDRKSNQYHDKPLLHHPWIAKLTVKVPRLAPPRTKIYPIVRGLRDRLGVQTNADGSLAFRDVDCVLKELVTRDAGKLGMPSVSELLAGQKKVTPVFMLDATGYGSQQLNTIAVRNPQMSASAHQLHYLGLGNCSDDRAGSSKLLGKNLDRINELFLNPKLPVTVGDVTSEVELEPLICTDVAALRHCEHITNSGWCCCSRDFALRQTPKTKPTNVDELRTLLKQCHSPTRLERFILSHSPLPGEDLPRPCTAPGCTFAHNRATARQEYEALLAEERRLAANVSKSGKSAFSRWRIKHATCHSNINPGLYGRPMFQHDLDQQILDPLHYGALGLPKTPWKHGVLNNASDDARVQISEYLAGTIKHPLDTRRKDDNRQRAQKWFTGERWLTFCTGERGSPGGPAAIAHIINSARKSGSPVSGGSPSSQVSVGAQAGLRRSHRSSRPSPTTWRRAASIAGLGRPPWPRCPSRREAV